MFVDQQDWLQPSQSAAPAVASMSASFSWILFVKWAERIPLDCMLAVHFINAGVFVAMSGRGLAADVGPGCCSAGPAQARYGVGGPGWLHEEHMYVCAQVGAVVLLFVR
jgi:hypothetical protein